MSYNVFLINICISFILSLIIGLERQWRRRAIGLRTNVLVCIGSFLFVAFSMEKNTTDLTRVAAQVVSGIGFLGAGVILRDGTNVKGLNTAATLWCNAAIGVLCAGGLLVEAITGTAFILFANIILRFFTNKFSNNKNKYTDYSFNIVCTQDNELKIKGLINQVINKKQVTLSDLSTHKNNDNIVISLLLTSNTENEYIADKLLNRLTIEPSVLSLTLNKKESSNQGNIDDDE